NLLMHFDGRRLHYFIRDREIYLDTAHGNLKLIDRTLKEPEEADLAGSGKIAAPLDGTVIAVNVKPGDRVTKGDIVVVLDAMKMEHQLRSDVNGVVAAVSVSERAQVKIRQILAEVTPDEE
ncbi:MAG TPA: biotin/lipoyl-binding protein, partial [Pseudomonadales bacterium]|nr:biotin/lipoyl-binding protein [Pseudomonadales bacterium]